MKRLSIVMILLFASITSKAQQPLIYITSYDDTGQTVYICNGKTENSFPAQFGMANLDQSIVITIDSTVSRGDSTAFQDLRTDRTSFVLGEFSGGAALYSPIRVGDDTLYETVYYNGQYTATASIIFHARSSPSLAMYGYTWTTAFLVDGNGFGELNQEEEPDTMHDPLGTSQIYLAGQSGMQNGGVGPGDQPVILRSCGGATIDSIYESGDFSEFSFDPFPTLPYAMPDDDSLVINFEFTPKIVDSSGLDHHYLIFHTTDGHYLTWSFEYKVYPAASVSETANADNSIRVFPNPAYGELQILGSLAGTARLFDLLGRERIDINDNGSGATLDVSRLEPGMYFLRLGNQSAKVEIAR